MIDDEAHRRAFDAEIQAHAATARADAAVETRDFLREDLNRLEKEASIAVSIAGEIFSTVLFTHPRLAGRLSQSILSQYGRYQDNRRFPNVGELLDRLGSVERR